MLCSSTTFVDWKVHYSFTWNILGFRNDVVGMHICIASQVFRKALSSFKGHVHVLRWFSALFALCSLIFGFVQGKEDREIFDSFRVKSTPISWLVLRVLALFLSIWIYCWVTTPLDYFCNPTLMEWMLYFFVFFLKKKVFR
jgi:hypothetical protein